MLNRNSITTSIKKYFTQLYNCKMIFILVFIFYLFCIISIGISIDKKSDIIIYKL